MATKEQPASRLLVLPAELRNDIYWLALVFSIPIVASPGCPRPCAALLGTCHQVRDEATQLFYKHNIFREQMKLYYIRRPLLSFNRANLRHIERFELRIPATTAQNLCLSHAYPRLKRLLRIFMIGTLQAGIRMESIQLLVQEPFGTRGLEEEFAETWGDAKDAVFALARGQLDDDYTNQSLVRAVRDAIEGDDDGRRRGPIIW